MISSLRQTARPHPELDSVPLRTFRVDSDDDAVAVLTQIIDYFGADPERSAVRLVLEGDVRYLEREGVDVYLVGEEKGFGASAGAALAGYSPSGSSTEFEFRCPVAGCPDSPLFVLTFTEPPTCRVHGTTLELVA